MSVAVIMMLVGYALFSLILFCSEAARRRLKRERDGLLAVTKQLESEAGDVAADRLRAAENVRELESERRKLRESVKQEARRRQQAEVTMEEAGFKRTEWLEDVARLLGCMPTEDGVREQIQALARAKIRLLELPAKVKAFEREMDELKEMVVDRASAIIGDDFVRKARDAGVTHDPGETATTKKGELTQDFFRKNRPVLDDRLVQGKCYQCDQAAHMEMKSGARICRKCAAEMLEASEGDLFGPGV